MRSNQPSVYFGHKTALQILREVPPADLVPARGKARELPRCAPGIPETREAIRRLEAAYPNLRLERPAHILVKSPSRGRDSQERKTHVCGGQLSGASFFRLGSYAATSTVPLAFVQAATLEPDEMSLILLAWELCGTYRTKRTAASSAYQIPALTTVRALQAYVARNPSVDGARKAARALRFCADDSASPRETKQALVIGLPMRHGGYGAGIPRMNYEVEASKEARAIAGRSSFRCDLCWPEAKLDVEYQSREMHEGERSRIRDSRRTNALKAMGWTVMGITNDELDSLTATDAIAFAIYRHLGRRFRVTTSDFHARKVKLRRRLGLPVERW